MAKWHGGTLRLYLRRIWITVIRISLVWFHLNKGNGMWGNQMRWAEAKQMRLSWSLCACGVCLLSNSFDCFIQMFLYQRNWLISAVWLISAWPCRLMRLEGTRWLALWLLEFPCLPQRHTHTHSHTGRQSSARAGLHVRQRFKTGKQPEVKSRQEFKAGQSAVWQRSGKHESGTEELMSRTRLQLPPTHHPTDLCICSVTVSGGATPLVSLPTHEAVSLPARQAKVWWERSSSARDTFDVCRHSRSSRAAVRLWNRLQTRLQA